jgi:hypothetical protein
MKLSGRIITWVGGLFLVVACFLHFGLDISLWGGDARDALFLTLLAAAGVTLSIVSIFVDFPVLVAAQAALAVYAFGQALTLGNGNFGGLQVGFWLAVIAAVAMVVGAALLSASIWSTSGWKATSGLVTASRPIVASLPSETQASVANGHPPAGWYSDPSGQASLRYWSGAAWTAEVRS